MHYLERGPSDDGETEGGENAIAALHFLYKHSDIKTNQTCGECHNIVLYFVNDFKNNFLTPVETF